jgi:2-polyprenyl-3-methyl-5-hydroxy-6-metoxy-1,4-benzoquinol methylase
MTLPAASYEPYLSFYGRHKISPVRQDISDMSRHFQRREYLYRYLGLPPLAITGRLVAEFGPGSGYNALYTTLLAPKRFLVVEGNPTGMAQCKKLLRENFPTYSGHEFVASRIQDFTTEERFDAVFCEGVIPHQKDPAAFSRHIGTFLRPGGVLVITTADYLSVFPEVLRRVICDTIVANDAPLSEKVSRLVPVFKSHYASLPGASRPIEDWLIDTLLDTWGNPLYSFENAISALSAEFEVYGSSPKFLTDWRWYKDLDTTSARLNETAIDQYHAHRLSLMDCRTVLPPQPTETVSAIAHLCEQAFWGMIKIRNSSEPDFSEIIDICSRIARASSRDLPNIAGPVGEVTTYLRAYKTADATASFDKFKSWFGRGQQYVSFVKKAW